MLSCCHGQRADGHTCAHVHGFSDPGPSAMQFWQYYRKGKVLLEFVVGR
jgi:hypothetical protein